MREMKAKTVISCQMTQEWSKEDSSRVSEIHDVELKTSFIAGR